MSKDLNHCTFIGRLGRDPDIRYTGGGSAVANFSIAVGEKYKDKGGDWVETTEWVNLVAFGKLAEIIEQHLSKGSRIYASGRFKTRKWQDKSGNDRYTTEIVVNELIMLDSKPAEPKQANTKPAQQEEAFPGDDDGFDSIPF